MYKVIYKYLANDKVKQAFVRAISEYSAKAFITNEYLVGAIQVLNVIECRDGTIVYPDGRF